MIAAAAEAAVVSLRREHPEHFYAFALLTSGEALAPYLSACSFEADAAGDGERWELSASPYAVWGHDDYFAPVEKAFADRGALFERETSRIDAEYALRLASMEEALRLLDVAGFFGVGIQRQETLLISCAMPPDHDDAGYVRRLNPEGPLYDEWLRECSEQPVLRSDTLPASFSTGAPNPTIAELWGTMSGLTLPDGVRAYGPEEMVERNEAYAVAPNAPGWSLVGEDRRGRGLFMRNTGAAFEPALGRAGSEVFLLDLGAITADVPVAGEFVTDDLIGWLAARQQDA